MPEINRIKQSAVFAEQGINECYDFRAGAGVIRAEVGFVFAGGDAILDGPKNCVAVILIGGNIFKGTGDVCRYRRSRKTPKESNDLCSCAILANAEGQITGAAGNPAASCPEDGMIVVFSGGDVCERALLLG